MDLKQAKDLLTTFNRWRRGEDVEPMLKPSDIGKAIDVAIQCLEDSIEVFQLMEAVDEVNKKLEIKRACRHPKNKTWTANGETFCEECNQFLI